MGITRTNHLPSSTHHLSTTNMKVSAIIAAIMALAGLAAGAPQDVVNVVTDERQAAVGAIFKNNLVLDNGHTFAEEGSEGSAGQANHAGSFAFTDPETGESFTVDFVADEGGFQPTGAHLPVAPPAPDHVADLLRIAEEQRASGVTFNEQGFQE